MKRLKPTLWLSFGLVSLTLALALTAYIFGFMPDGYKAELDSRAKVAESIAVQLAGAVNRNDTVTLKETIDSIVNRNDDIRSSALRNSEDKIIISAGDHQKHWRPSKGSKSTPTHVIVPLLGADGPQGTIEISFGPPTAGKRILGFPVSLLLFLSFLMTTGFIGYFFILRRTLKELDPGRVIPERVQKAFDTLSEGVIILDEQQRILLVNNAFAEMYGDSEGPAIGSKINHLPWRMVDGSAVKGGYPWHTALREDREMREGSLSLRTPDGQIHNLNINATVISGEKDKTIGAIVTLRDLTGAKRNKDDLDKTLNELQNTQREVKRQNRELTYLANHDSLTGCLNRRAFFARFQTEIEQAPDLGTPISMTMIGFDQFVSINDSSGTVVSDALIINVANLIKAECGNENFVSRHASDKFCVSMVSMTEEAAIELAEKIKKSVLDSSRQLLPAGAQATLSIGIAVRDSGSCTAHSMTHRAEKALNVASRKGDGHLQIWSKAMAQPSKKQAANKASLEQSATGKQPSQIMFPSANIQPKLSDGEQQLQDAANAHSTFFNKAEQSLRLAKQKDKPLAILQMSLVSWEYLGEALGEELRQKLMLAVKQKVASTLRENDGVLVLGDNGEWLIELNDLDKPDDVNWIIQRLLDAVREPIQIAGQSMYVTGKIGVALFPADGNNVPTLAQNARIAMRRAVEEKQLIGHKFYTAEMTNSSNERLNLESGIRSALENDGFELYFQPIVNVKTSTLSGVEALLRCDNEQLDKVPIDHVISIAEKSSLITEIDMWVLKQSMRQLQTWLDADIQPPTVSINLSAKQLNNAGFMDDVFGTIRAAKFSPSRIQIEITETAQMKDVDSAAPHLKRLQQLGVQIALDDFGTGQASISYLQRLHPDVIKIDSSFITGINTNHANATMVSAMIVMAHCLGLKVVAEGIEDKDQVDFLRKTNCDDIQGYLISRPMPAQMMGEWMKRYIKENGTGKFVENHQAKDEPITPPLTEAAA